MSINNLFTIDPIKPFSKSLIWQMQLDYYHKAGISAWRSGEVPHYITSNPVVGKTYAELFLALLRDLSLKGKTTETVYLMELGVGHGRLCYHFLKHFEKYYENSALRLPPVCYVLSDFTESNLGFWKTHPRLQPYLEKGWLDFALFNAESDTEIKLRNSGKLLDTESLEQPIVVVANYFFDTIPQELFRIQKGKIEQALLGISSEHDKEKTDPAQLIGSLKLEYDYEEANYPIYPNERKLNTLLHFYQKHLSDSHLLFPHVGIRCLKKLKSLSKAGLVLLSADKGEHHLSNLDHRSAPKLKTHGSFSLIVNYHALKLYCENEGGTSLFPRHQHTSLDLCCLLFLHEASSYLETINAYDKFVQDYGPDDYFNLKKLVEKSLGSLSYRNIIAVTRLSGYDAQIFQQMLPDLSTQLETISNNERWNLLHIIPRIWDTYFPLREAEDFALNLGNLLLNLQFYKEAILYYEKSIVTYGKKEHVLYSIALCYCLLDDFNAARPFVTELIRFTPDNNALRELIEKFGINIIQER